MGPMLLTWMGAVALLAALSTALLLLLRRLLMRQWPGGSLCTRGYGRVVLALAWVCAVGTAGGCGLQTMSAGPSAVCGSGCTRSFTFEVPGGVYIMRARLTAEAYGDLDYGPNEYARVLVDGNQHGPKCFGAEDAWIACADDEDVTALLATQNGASSITVSMVSSSGAATFQAKATVVLEYSVTPWLGPVTGGTSISLGRGCTSMIAPSVSRSGWSCEFARGEAAPFLTDAVFDATTQVVQCATPAVLPTHMGWYNVSIVGADGEALSPAVVFYAYGSATDITTEPVTGSLESNTAVRFTSVEIDGVLSVSVGASLGRARAIADGCMFGATPTNLVYDAVGDSYACMSPAGSGSAPISSIALNGQQHIYLPDLMLVRDSAHSGDIAVVQYFTPVAVPRSGGTRVRLRTSNLVGTSFMCLFKPFAIVDAEFSSSADTVSCVFPESAHAAELPPHMVLEITTDGDHFSDDAVELNVYSVARIQCAHGPSAGGHSTTLHGAGFIDETTGLLLPALNRKVRFGHDPVPYVPSDGTTSTLSIVTPPGTAGDRVPVEVTFIGNDPQCQNGVVPGCYTSDDVLYSYIGVHSVHPFSGPATGDTNVTVIGVNFGECEAVSCRFGTVVVPAHIMSPTSLWCISPAAEVGSSALEVSMNGVDFSTDEVQFVHFAVPTVGAILPSRGSQYSCNSVVAFGLNLNGGTDYKCRLGDAIVSASYDSVSSSVECECAVSAVPGRVFLEVSLNGQQYTTSGIEFEFMTSNIVDMSAYSGTATGFETVDIHFSFPGPPSLDYLCVWNGYAFPATYLVDREYETQDGHLVGVARCVTPEADTIPYTQLRTAFEEPEALTGRRASLDETNATCPGTLLPSELTNGNAAPVVAYGAGVPLLYDSSRILKFGVGRWEGSFRTSFTALHATEWAATLANKSNGSVYPAEVDRCYVPTIGIVDGFVDTDDTVILPHSGEGMYVMHGTQGFVTVEMEAINLEQSDHRGNLTFSCWMQMGAQTSNRARIWAEPNNGSEVVLFEFVEPEIIVPEPEPWDDVTIEASVDIAMDGRATHSALLTAVGNSIPTVFGNALLYGLDIVVAEFLQRVETTSALPDTTSALRDWVSAAGTAARAQFRYGVALVFGIDVSKVKVISAVDDGDDPDVAVLSYSLEADHDTYPTYATSDFSDLLAASINSAGSQLSELEGSDVITGEVAFISSFKVNVSFHVNQTYNVSNITDTVQVALTNTKTILDALYVLNATQNASNATVIADVVDMNATVLEMGYEPFFGFPEPEPEVPEDADVAIYRTWMQFSKSVDLSWSTSVVLKFGALFVEGNETYAFDDCRVSRPVGFPLDAGVHIKALYGQTVNEVVYKLRTPQITSITPLSGIITGGTNLTIGMNYPGIASSTVQCGFNGVLMDAQYLSIANAVGVVSCVAPHLGYCHPGAPQYSSGCIVQQSLLTISTPYSLTLTLVVDGIKSSNEATFMYTAVASLNYIFPNSGPSFESIVIIGDRLEQGTDYVARFGDQLATAVYQDGSCETGSCRVLTTAPGGSVGTVLSVELALNGQQFSSSGLTFTFTDVDECNPSPCLHGATCRESSTSQYIALLEFECICTDGWEGQTCEIDANECESVPCLNGATCVDSQDLVSIPIAEYRCTCASGWANTHCDQDIDECLSAPCQNGAACSESSSSNAVPAGHFSCACTAGYASGMCNYDFIDEYEDLCTVAIDSVCDLDVYECASNPCQNGGVCTDSYDASEIDFTSPLLPHEYLPGMSSDIPADRYSCACAAGFANGLCNYDYIDAYTSSCTVDLGGFCDVDVDECASTPCTNGATCEDSRTTQLVRQRTVPQPLGLQTGNTTDDMMRSSSVKPGAIGCATENGRLNHGVSGWPSYSAAWCPAYARASEYLEIQFAQKHVIVAVETQGRYNTGQWVKRYSLAFSVDGTSWEPYDEVLPGNTDETSIVRNDLAEPLVALHFRIHPEEWHAWPSLRLELYGFHFGPIHFHAFSCTCAPGYGNGVCGYDYLPVHEVQCAVAEGGVCDLDMNECDSNPCANGGTCVDSVTDSSIPPDGYACHCAPGFADGTCNYDYIAAVADSCNIQLGGSCGIDVDECLSKPCANGGTCSDSTSLARPGPIPEPPLVYIRGESTILTLGSLPQTGIEKSTERLLTYFSGKRLSVAESELASINTTTKLRLIVADQSREFDQDSLAGVAAREQLLAGLAVATIDAEPTVSLDSVRYSSSYSTLPATHVVGNQSVDVSYDWLAAGEAEPIAVGLQDGSIPVTLPDSAFMATSRLRFSEDEGEDDERNFPEFARLNGPKQWTSKAVIPDPSPIGIAAGSSLRIPDSSLTASSEYYVKASQATWVSVDTVIRSAEELQDWLSTSTGAGLTNELVCAQRNGIDECAYACFECYDESTDTAQFPMYLSLDSDHGHDSNATTTVASFMRWRYPNVAWTGWRKVPLNNGEPPALIDEDLRGRSLFVVGQLDSDARLRSENTRRLVGYQAIQYSEDLGQVLYPVGEARLNSESHWLPARIEEDPEPWVQVDIGRTARISGVATQGAGTYEERVTGFVVSWSHDGETFNVIDAVFLGNQERNTTVDHWFPDVVVARYIRLTITSFEGYAALRWEVYEDIPWTGNEYLQVDLQHQAVLTKIATQGSAENSEHWITAYSVSYRTNEDDSWEYYTEQGDVKVFDGNVDSNTVKHNHFQGRVEARYFRLHLYSFNIRAALRMELYREPLDYFIVDATIESPVDTSAIVDAADYKSILVSHANGAGAFKLQPTDVALFTPMVTASIRYNFTGLVNISTSVNVSRLEEDLASALNTADEVLAFIQTAPEHPYRVYDVNVTSVITATRETFLEPEPEPEPYYVPPDSYTCACRRGWADGMCEYEYISQYYEECNRQLGGHCALDVDECASTPCQNGGSCADLSASADEYSDVAYCELLAPPDNFRCGVTVHVVVRLYGHEMTWSMDSGTVYGPYPAAASATANEAHYYTTVHLTSLASAGTEHTVHLFDANGDGWHGGYLEILDNFGDVIVGPISPVASEYQQVFEHFCHCGTDEYACRCRAGYANGVCEHEYLSLYESDCTVMAGGACDIDVDECSSSPCINGATCVESTVDATIAANTYRCICAAGYAGGVCDYTFIAEVAVECTQATGGFCDIDVDECASNPCLNGATCTESTSLDMIPVHSYSCSCMPGFANGLCSYEFIAEYARNCTIGLGGHCDIDVDECISSPCTNTAECSDSTGEMSSVSANAYRCTCTAGYANGWCNYEYISDYESACTMETGGHCEIDVDECISNACDSDSTCIESSMLRQRSLIISEYMEGSASNDAIEIYNPTCHPVQLDGYSLRKAADGGTWADAAAVASAVNLVGVLGPGEVYVLCNMRFDDEMIDATGARYIDRCDYVADTFYKVNFEGDDAIGLLFDLTLVDAVGLAGADPGDWWATGRSNELSTRQHTLLRTPATVSGSTDWLSSASTQWEGFAQPARPADNMFDTLGVHAAELHCDRYTIDGYVCLCSDGWSGENCAIDVDECASNPCQHGATCSDSSGNAAVPVDRYRCTCAPGFANGMCAYDFISNYSASCSVQTGGFCDVDVNECASHPCANDAPCTDSTSVESSIAANEYSCSCRPGFANGLCNYTFVEQYAEQCLLATGGHCDTDVNECASNPCANGAACSDSGAGIVNNRTVPIDAFSCACIHGFASGMCEYDYPQVYEQNCTVFTGGACNEDANECLSIPCLNGASCVDSTLDRTIGVGFYACICLAGYAGRECQTDVDDCASNPCINNGTCIDGIDGYRCHCPGGWDGDECEFRVDPCERTEDDCSGNSTCIHTAPGSHLCLCDQGYLYLSHSRYRYVTVGDNSSASDDLVCLDTDECLSNPCLNAADCIHLVDGYSCQCKPGYEDGRCGTDINECESDPCQHGVCADVVANYTCYCEFGYAGNNCNVDIDECSSEPCYNEASCMDSTVSTRIAKDFFVCTCAAGYTGELCDVDVDECASNPCENGGVCLDSQNATSILAELTGVAAIRPGTYHCSCKQGYGNGWCAFAFYHAFVDVCRVEEGGHCDVDLNECSSAPCSNGANCVESFRDDEVPPHAYACVCLPGFANGRCEYDFMPEYRSVCSIGTSGRCDIDVDECASMPCLNGAQCVDSSQASEVPVHRYSCICTEGFANGWCGYSYLDEFSDECTQRLGGHCDIDVDECASDPCTNGATCTESSVDATVSVDEYVCTCLPGFANGMCHYLFVLEYAVACSRVEGGSCDVDVNECISNPCQHGATCTESTSDASISPHAYRCQCAPGFANGKCEYDFIDEYQDACKVMESGPTMSAAANVGNCDLDVDECVSNPCYNGAVCLQSTSSDSVSLHAYSCLCAPGYADGMCDYSYIPEYEPECVIMESTSSLVGNGNGNCRVDVDECSSSPCANGAACTDRGAIDSFTCTCRGGYDGQLCNIDTAECASAPCRHGATCSEDAGKPNEYACVCTSGWSGANCEIDVDECASSPCRSPAPCTDGIGFFRCGAPLQVQLVLETTLDEWDEAFEVTFREEIAERLDVDVSRVKVVGLAEGSLVVDVQILPPANGAETGLPEAAELWQTQFASGAVAIGGIPVAAREMTVAEGPLGCPRGYDGLDCSINIDDCRSWPCSHLGTCVDKIDAYKCNCQVGWSGDNCEHKLNMDAEFSRILGSQFLGAVPGLTLVVCVLLYVKMNRIRMDLNTQHFSYALHAAGSTLTFGGAVVATILFASYVRPSTAGFYSHIRVMAPKGDTSYVDLALPCPARAGSAVEHGGCECSTGYERHSAPGQSLCITEPRFCVNETFYYCAAVFGDDTTVDTLTVDLFDSCEGACADAEQFGRALKLLLGLYLIAFCCEWACVLVNIFTHLHRVPACMPMWEWRFPPSYRVYVAFRWASVTLHVATGILLAVLSNSVAGLITADCFPPDSVFALNSIEQHLGMAFGACIVNTVIGILNLVVIQCGFLYMRRTKLSSVASSTRYLEPPPPAARDERALVEAGIMGSVGADSDDEDGRGLPMLAAGHAGVRGGSTVHAARSESSWRGDLSGEAPESQASAKREINNDPRRRGRRRTSVTSFMEFSAHAAPGGAPSESQASAQREIKDDPRRRGRRRTSVTSFMEFSAHAAPDRRPAALPGAVAETSSSKVTDATSQRATPFSLADSVRARTSLGRAQKYLHEVRQEEQAKRKPRSPPDEGGSFAGTAGGGYSR